MFAVPLPVGALLPLWTGRGDWRGLRGAWTSVVRGAALVDQTLDHSVSDFSESSNHIMLVEVGIVLYFTRHFCPL